MSPETVNFLKTQRKTLVELAPLLGINDQNVYDTVINKFLNSSNTKYEVDNKLAIKDGVYPVTNTIYALDNVSILLAAGDKLKSLVEYCNKNSSGRECHNYLPRTFVINNVLNTDVTTGTISKTGAGWNQYPFSMATTTNNTATFYFNDIKKGSRVKCIACIFQSAEVNDSSSKFSKFYALVNDQQNYSTQTAHTQDGNYNWTLFFLPITNYPITLNSIQLSVNCPGKSVTIVNGQLAIVYS